jgi:ATP-dependent Clp protease ATP-binding subunit ClpB
VRAAFRPEFLNRLDEILLFRRLSRVDMVGIVDIQLKQLQKLLDERKVTLDIDAEAKKWLEMPDTTRSMAPGHLSG